MCLYRDNITKKVMFFIFPTRSVQKPDFQEGPVSGNQFTFIQNLIDIDVDK